MHFGLRNQRFGRDLRGFTRLEFGLLTAMLGAMVINGIASLGGGLGSGHKPIGTVEQAAEAAPLPPAPAP